MDEFIKLEKQLSLIFLRTGKNRSAVSIPLQKTIKNWKDDAMTANIKRLISDGFTPIMLKMAIILATNLLVGCISEPCCINSRIGTKRLKLTNSESAHKMSTNPSNAVLYG